MIVDCPNCAAKFNLPDGAIGAAGRKMRCAKCGHKWLQMPPDAPEEALAEAGDVPAGAAPRPVAAAPPPLGDLPLEMEPVGGGARRPPPDAGDLPMESGLSHGEDETTDLDALADMLDRNAQLTDDDAPAGKPRDIDSLLEADDPAPIPSMFGTEEDEEDTPRRRWPAVAAAVVLVLAGLGAGAWFGRAQVIDMVPQAAALYAALGLPAETMGAGLRFQNVAGERVVENGIDTLIVRGFIANVSDAPRTLPHLKLTLFDAQDNPVQSMVSRPPQPTVEPDSNAGFRLTLENPPATARRFEVDWTAAPDGASAADRAGPATHG